MATKFLPLSLALINEGQFLEDIDDDLRELQRKLANFQRTYGIESLKAVAKLKIEISLKVENDESDGAFSITTSVATIEPKRPKTLSLAIGGVDEDNNMALFVRASGSDENHPKQLKLATKNGQVINQETGEILDE